MYRGRYYKQTPPGYSGVAFASDTPAEVAKENLTQERNTPTPVKNGAGDRQIKTDVDRMRETTLENIGRELRHTRPPLSEMSSDMRNEITRLPRDFSGTSSSDRSTDMVQGLFQDSQEEKREAQAVLAEPKDGLPFQDESGVQMRYDEKESSTQGEGRKKGSPIELLTSLFKTSFTLEDLLLMGATLLLATKENDDEALPFLAIAVMLLGSK